MKKLIKNSGAKLLIIAVFLVFSFPFWGQGKIPFPSSYLVNNFPPWQYYYGFPVRNPAMPDIGSQIFPWRDIAINLLKQGQWPLWNPYNFSGTPLLANYQSAAFHPGNFLFWVLPTASAWSILVLLPLFLAPLFTFFYLKEIGFKKLAALISSFAFGFCGFIICWLAYGTLAWAILWLPLALYLVEKFRQGKTWVGPFFSLVTAFSLFSGHFQISLYLLGTVFLYLVFQCQNRQRKKLFVFFFLGICLAATQWLPAIEFYKQSVRSNSFNPGESIPLKYLITFFAPDFFGNPVTRNNWFGHYAEWAGFIGVIPLLLGVYGLLFGKNNFFRRFFIGLTLLALAIAVRSPVQGWLAGLKIPVLSTSAFSRIIVLYSFGMAVLAAFGLEQLMKDWSKQRLKRLILFLFFFGLIFVIAWIWVFLSDNSWAAVSKRNLILPSVMFGAAAAIFLAGLIKKDWWQQLLVFGLFFLAIFDLFRFAQKWLPFDSREHFYPQLEVIEFLQTKTQKGDRVFGNFGGEMNVFQIPGIEGYDPLFIKRYGELMTSVGDGQIKDLSPLTVYVNKGGQFTYKILNLLGVKYLLHAKTDGQNVWAFPFWQYSDNFEKIWEDDQYQVWLNKQTFPRAFLVNDYQVIRESQEMVDFMLIEKTSLKQTAVLEVEPDFEIQTCANRGNAEIIDYQPNRVVIDLEANCWSLLVLTDNFYPGWQATIDGQPTKIYRTDYSFRGVVVPDGKHEVVFEYRPISFRWGLMFTYLAVAGILWSLKDDENRSF